LRGEDLDTLARELKLEPEQVVAWRDKFLAGGARPSSSIATATRVTSPSGGVQAEVHA